MTEKITGAEAKRRVRLHVEQLKSDYDALWVRYCEVVHENVALAKENDKLRNGATR